jgi:ParB/RepB/Spo0J family partition protein
MIQQIPLSLLRPNSLNPRTHFDEQALAELAASIKADGVLENLIVRPAWCVGTITDNQLRAATPNTTDHEPGFEVVSGDRRLKAAMTVLPSETAVECRIVEKTDPEALRLNLAEQIQRNQLTPLEEADGFARMLAFRSAEGEPLHTVASLAEGMGVSEDYVQSRLRLVPLPASVKKALAADKIGIGVAKVVASVPDPEQRDVFAKEVLSAGRDGGPLTAEEAQELLQERYVVDLRGAPFNPEDGELCSTTVRAENPSGKCSTCPYRTSGGGAGKSGARANRCTNTACYKTKCMASIVQVANEALAKGFAVLSVESSRRLFETHRSTELRLDGDYADLSAKPFTHLLKPEVAAVPTWQELADKAEKAGMQPAKVFAIDGELRPRWLVKTAPLIAAADKIGEPIFKGSNSDAAPTGPRPGEDTNDRFRREQREMAERQKQASIAESEERRRAAVILAAGVRAVHAALVKSWVPVPVWDVMLDLILACNQVPTWHLLADLLAMKRETPSAKLRAELNKRRQQEQQACVPLLLAAHDCARVGHESSELRALAKHVGVSLAIIARDEREKMEQAAKAKAPKAKASKPPKGAAAKAVRAVKASIKKPAKAGKGGAR